MERNCFFENYLESEVEKYWQEEKDKRKKRDFMLVSQRGYAVGGETYVCTIFCASRQGLIVMVKDYPYTLYSEFNPTEHIWKESAD